MLTDPGLRSKVDEMWDRLWSSGLSNPMDSIEQFSYLLFLKRTKAKQQDPEPIQLKLPGMQEGDEMRSLLLPVALSASNPLPIVALVNHVRASPRSMQVRELGYRWGSCGHKGDLYFHASCSDAAASDAIVCGCS